MAKPVRRIVTDHDTNGKAIVTMDGPAPNVRTRAASGLTATQIWMTEESPANIERHDDPSLRINGTSPPPRGSICRVVEFPPIGDLGKIDHEAVLKEMGVSHGGDHGKPARSPFMHRTRSIDYAICLEGEIDMLLDDTEVKMRAGDVMVQQGTNHAWVNNSDKICRICFVLIDGVEPEAWKKG
jgi:hypothetical protein